MAFKPFPSSHTVASADLNDLVGNYDRSTSEVDAVNTAAETTMYTRTIAAQAMSSDRTLRLRIIADYLNDSGSARSITILIKLGGTTIATISVGGIGVSATRLAGSFEVEIQNRGATNAQLISVRAPNFSSNTIIEALPVTAAIDTTAARDLVVTAQHSAAHASLSYRKRGATLELL